MSDPVLTCGTGNWGGPKPGDPSEAYGLNATPAFGGIDVTWFFPDINPYAVAHFILYKGTIPVFENALRRAVVNGSGFFDAIQEPIPLEYFYWIQIVSVNGTVSDPIGPASAYPRPMIGDLITLLTGQIDAGVLAQSLKTDIDRIFSLENNLSTEISDRLNDSETLAAALDAVQSETGEALTLFNSEVNQRIEGQTALVSMVESIAAGVDDSQAAVILEREARVSADEAIGRELTIIYGAVGDNESAIINEAELRVNALESMTEVFEGQLSTLKTTIGEEYTAAIGTSATTLAQATSSLAEKVDTVQAFAVTKGKVLTQNFIPFFADELSQNLWIDTTDGKNTPKQWNGTAWVEVSDKVAKDAMAGVVANAASIQTVAKAVTDGDGALAQQINTVEAVLDGDVASGQVGLVANVSTINGKVTAIGALYTAKVQVNGLIGGFGVYNDGQEVQAGFDVDTFWVGRTGAQGRKPFIIKDSEVFIDNAVINQLTADKIDARGLSIKDMDGNIILAAGTSLDWSRIGGTNKAEDGATRNFFRGGWVTVGMYSVGDVVTYEGSAWVAKIGHSSTSGTVPPVLPSTSNNYWGLYAQKGDTGPQGATGAPAGMLYLTATSQVFKIEKNGSNSPSSITFNSITQNLGGSPTFSITGGTLTGTGATRTLTFANMTSEMAVITVDQGGISDSITVVKLREGLDGTGVSIKGTLENTGLLPSSGNTNGDAYIIGGHLYVWGNNSWSDVGLIQGPQGIHGEDGIDGTNALTGFLTNESQVLSANASGTVFSIDFTAHAKGTFKVYFGTQDITINNTVVYSVVSQSGCTGTINSSTGAYAVTAMSADNASMLLRATLGASVIEKVFSLAKSKTGIAGANPVVGYLTNETVTLSASTTGEVTAAVLSANAKGTFRVYDGINLLSPASVTFSVVSAVGCVGTIDNASGNYAVSSMGSDTAVLNLRAVYQGVSIDKVFALSKSKTGVTGNKGDTGPAIVLRPSGQAFTFTDTRPNPALQSLVFDAFLHNITGSVSWSTSPAVTLTGTGNARTLSIANFGTRKQVVVTATINGVSDSVTVVRLEQTTAEAGATAGSYLLTGNFIGGLDSWTISRDGDPITRATSPGALITNDPNFGVCGEYKNLLSAGHNILTKKVTPVTPGRIYKTTATFKVTALPPDGITQFNIVVPGQTETYANAGTVFGSERRSVGLVGEVVSVSAIFSTTPQSGVQTLSSTARYFRAGLRLDTTETAAPTVRIRSVLTEDITDAFNAQVSANAASQAASTAQGSAATANNLLTDIANDNKLTASEKQQTKLEWDGIVAEKAGINSQATAFNISTENINYNNAYNTLSTYITPLLSSLTTTSDIVGSTFRSRFSSLYSTRQILLNKIASEAGKRATWGSIDGVGKPANNATKNTIYRQSTVPAGATDGDIWIDTTTSQHVEKIRIAGVWQVSATVGATFTASQPGTITGQITGGVGGNITTYIANAAIGNAQIGNAAIKNAQIDDLAVDTAKIKDLAVNTLQIAGNAVTVPTVAVSSNQITTSTSWQTISFDIINFTQPAQIICTISSSWLGTTANNFGGDYRVVGPNGVTLGLAHFVGIPNAGEVSNTTVLPVFWGGGAGVVSLQARGYDIGIYKPFRANVYYSTIMTLGLKK